MYEMKARVRYSEVDETLCMTHSAMIDYFQDCATFHSEDSGYPCDMLIEKGLGWFITAWQVKLNRAPKLGERLLVRTSPYNAKPLLASRYFEMLTEEGEVLSRANSLWIFMDIKHGKHARVLKGMYEAYGIDTPPAEEFGSRKILVKAEGKERLYDFTVGKSMLDTNHHMNNARYLDIAEKLLLSEEKCKGFRVMYQEQAKEGDRIVVYSTQSDLSQVISMEAENGKPYCTAEFLFEAMRG